MWDTQSVGPFSATGLGGFGFDAANPRHRLLAHLPGLRRLLMDLVPYSVLYWCCDDEHALHYYC